MKSLFFYYSPTFPSSFHLSLPLFPGRISNFTPFSCLLFIKVGIGKILLVLLSSKKRYAEKTRGGGCSNPPPWLTTIQPKKSKLARWCLSLAEFYFTIEHWPGRVNVVPDTLSRATVPSSDIQCALPNIPSHEAGNFLVSVIGFDISFPIYVSVYALFIHTLECISYIRNIPLSHSASNPQFLIPLVHLTSFPGDFITKVKQINSQSDIISMSSFAGPSYLSTRSFLNLKSLYFQSLQCLPNLILLHNFAE